MMYSCFNPGRGTYDYYADRREIPINADLPIPKLPRATGAIGVPAIDAGRPMPADAQKVGEGWHARGMIVNCGRGPMGAAEFPTADEAWDWVKDGGWKYIAGGLAALWIVRRI